MPLTNGKCKNANSTAKCHFQLHSTKSGDAAHARLNTRSTNSGDASAFRITPGELMRLACLRRRCNEDQGSSPEAAGVKPAATRRTLLSQPRQMHADREEVFVTISMELHYMWMNVDASRGGLKAAGSDEVWGCVWLPVLPLPAVASQHPSRHNIQSIQIADI